MTNFGLNNMALYKVSIYPETQWDITVEAESEEEAKKKALEADGPTTYGHMTDDEWQAQIWEWPNIGNGQVDVEKV